MNGDVTPKLDELIQQCLESLEKRAGVYPTYKLSDINRKFLEQIITINIVAIGDKRYNTIQHILKRGWYDNEERDMLNYSKSYWYLILIKSNLVNK